jgi:preprotein translocase subunit SecG
MYTAIIVLHLAVCLFLIFIILIQSSKGAEMGAAFGGSNQTLFGSRGAATFLSKLTTGAAILFMITSLTLAIMAVRKGSVMTSVPVQQTSEKPFATAPEPVQGQPVAPMTDAVPVEPAPAAEEGKPESK